MIGFPTISAIRVFEIGMHKVVQKPEMSDFQFSLYGECLKSKLVWISEPH